MRQMQGGVGGSGGAMTFGKSRARLLGENQVDVTFADVAGIEEAKDEVFEIVEFLKDPNKFERLGGKRLYWHTVNLFDDPVSHKQGTR